MVFIYFLGIALVAYLLVCNSVKGRFLKGIVALGSCIFLGVLTCHETYKYWDEYTTLKTAYENKDYIIVEGFVENYNTISYGKGMEDFEINGIRFEYTDNTGTVAYHRTKDRGSVIIKHGQKLRIGYVRDKDMNKIIYIEELPQTWEDYMEIR